MQGQHNAVQYNNVATKKRSDTLCGAMQCQAAVMATAVGKTLAANRVVLDPGFLHLPPEFSFLSLRMGETIFLEVDANTNIVRIENFNLIRCCGARECAGGGTGQHNLRGTPCRHTQLFSQHDSKDCVDDQDTPQAAPTERRTNERKKERTNQQSNKSSTGKGTKRFSLKINTNTHIHTHTIRETTITTMDKAKDAAKEKLALLREKLDQIPVMQQAEVR